MSTLHVLEHYTSIQGEGPRTGTLTQFVRFAGCNLRCPGWPCDTPQAIFPNQYIGKYQLSEPDELRKAIEARTAEDGSMNICFTGGEPFLQSEFLMTNLLHQLIPKWYEVEVFTNGTKVIPQQWVDHAQINMDWKLTGSGEGQVGHDIRMANAFRLKKTDMIKFVVKDQVDLDEAEQVRKMLFNDMGIDVEYWIGSAWHWIPEHDLVAWIKLQGGGWKLNVQVHKFIWSADTRLV